MNGRAVKQRLQHGIDVASVAQVGEADLTYAIERQRIRNESLELNAHQEVSSACGT